MVGYYCPPQINARTRGQPPPMLTQTDRFWPKLKRNLLWLFAVMAGVMPPTNTTSRKATPMGRLKSPFIEKDISDRSMPWRRYGTKPMRVLMRACVRVHTSVCAFCWVLNEGMPVQSVTKTNARQSPHNIYHATQHKHTHLVYQRQHSIPEYLRCSRECRRGGTGRCATCPAWGLGRHRTPNCSCRLLSHVAA